MANVYKGNKFYSSNPIVRASNKQYYYGKSYNDFMNGAGAFILIGTIIIGIIAVACAFGA